MQKKALLFTSIFAVSCGGGTFESGGTGGAPGSGGKPGASGGAASGGKQGIGGNPGSGGRPGSGGAMGVGGGSAMSGGSSAGGTASGGNSGLGGESTGGAASGGGSTGGSSGGACSPACGEARECCGGQCVNLTNDPLNCGSCGHKCTGTTYCGGGQCVEPPCTATCNDGGSCCGSECCGQGQLCCDPQGPLDRGPTCVTPSEQGTCPMGCAPLCICASPDTLIATASGNREIASLKVGDLVYSVDHGVVKLVPLLDVHHTPVKNHSVVQVELASGAVLEISGRHPTADGRSFSGLLAGALLDGVQIKRVRVVPYHHAATYDILPASDTGAYFAGGVLIGSTLARTPALVMAPTVPLSSMASR
ncbi:MAG: hypothetical protein SFV15_21030 [Polyangiaceae bacterium]|nr:hypothetical protein [Polyangiaceae bacterium]